ncbi:MAG: hypothetical protein IME95_04760 [Proteobacteria bacterium]|nr:hypothetical protein [Pseudomonadota bacterium]
MRLFERKYRATHGQKDQGSKIALDHGLPKILRELPPGTHSYERMFMLKRVSGFKTTIDSINTYKVISQDKKRLEKKCGELGIIPVFEGDYISLDSFPRRNIIKEEIMHVLFRNGVKTIQKKSYFDILDYITPE